MAVAKTSQKVSTPRLAQELLIAHVKAVGLPIDSDMDRVASKAIKLAEAMARRT